MAERDEHDGLSPELDAELGRMSATLDAEVRAEQADYEAMAVRAAKRARRLDDVAREWMVHGDIIEVSIANLVLSGRVIHVRGDLLVLATPLRPAVDVSLAAGPVLRLVERSTGSGQRPGSGAKSFVARLSEHELSGQAMTFVLTGGSQLQGTVSAVAVDHVLSEGAAGTHAIPLARLALVWPTT